MDFWDEIFELHLPSPSFMKRLLILLLFFQFTLLKAQEYQIVNKNDFIINGKLALFTTKKDLNKVVKRYDEVNLIDMAMECGFEEEIKKGIQFYIYKKNGLSYFVHGRKAEFEYIDFEEHNDNFITYKNQKISSQTTISEIEKYSQLPLKILLVK